MARREKVESKMAQEGNKAELLVPESVACVKLIGSILGVLVPRSAVQTLKQAVSLKKLILWKLHYCHFCSDGY